MKYIAIAVLLAIVVGAFAQYLNSEGKPPPPGQNSGWMQH